MEFYIRPINAGDGKGINELRRMPGVFENILGIPSERIPTADEIFVLVCSGK
jgi:putative acetyltransferase